MTRKLLFLAIGVLAACDVEREPTATRAAWAQWASAFGTMGDDYVQAVAADAEGNGYAAGTLGTGTEIFVREFGRDGSVLFDRRWPSTNVFISGLATGPGGGIVLTVTGGQAGSVDLGAGPTTGNVIAAIDASGSLLWQRDSGPLDASGNGTRPSYHRVAIGPSGDIAVRGTDTGGPFLALLDRTGNEIWRRAAGDGSSEDAGLAIDASGHITIEDYPWAAERLLGQPMLVRYDPAGNLVWRVSVVDAMLPAIAAMPSGDVVVVWGSSTGSFLRRYRAVDGALVSAATVPLFANALVAADETRVVMAGNAWDETDPCSWRLGWYDLSTGGVSTVTVGTCRDFHASSLALVPGGDAFLGGGFATPTDFSTGTVLPPRGWDAFLVDVAR